MVRRRSSASLTLQQAAAAGTPRRRRCPRPRRRRQPGPAAAWRRRSSARRRAASSQVSLLLVMGNKFRVVLCGMRGTVWRVQDYKCTYYVLIPGILISPRERERGREKGFILKNKGRVRGWSKGAPQLMRREGKASASSPAGGCILCLYCNTIL